MHRVVANPFTPVPANPKSHVRGWAEHWAQSTDTVVEGKEADFSKMDYLLLDHGVNAADGQLNLFGGVTDAIAQNLIDICYNPGMIIYSLDRQMGVMNYPDNLRKRLDQKTCSSFMNERIVDVIAKRFAKATTLTQYMLESDWITIGDSHSTAFAQKGSAVSRTNGLTLHGAIERGHFRAEFEKFLHPPKAVTLVAGSIDIRHHVGRQSSPEEAIDDLVNAYVAEAEWLSSEHLVAVELACPVPVEYDGRMIPQSGFYKGEPFYGSQQERAEWTARFISKLRLRWPDVICPPDFWYDMDPERYAKEYMELKSSVHISPTEYRSKGGWD